MAEAVKLYQEIGFPALQKGSHDKKLIGYFVDNPHSPGGRPGPVGLGLNWPGA